MLKELKFVQGAVAKKDLMPALTHFRIEGGEVRSFNGSLALSSPIEFDIDCTPKAVPFVNAIAKCKDTVTLSMTPAGRLSIKSGSFKAFVECVDTETPHVIPEGEIYDVQGADLLAALKAVAPFMSDDASRPWSNGVLLDGQSAFATNNVVLVEYWVGSVFPYRVCIPRDAVREIVRIGEAPVQVQGDERSLSFLYEDGRWIRTNLISTAWPDLAKVLNRECNPQPVNQAIFEALEDLKPFVDKLERIYIDGDTLSTTMEREEGASSVVEGLEMTGVYSRSMLQLLQGTALKADFTQYPQPCLFFGDRLRGAIVGLKA